MEQTGKATELILSKNEPKFIHKIIKMIKQLERLDEQKLKVLLKLVHMDLKEPLNKLVQKHFVKFMEVVLKIRTVEKDYLKNGLSFTGLDTDGNKIFVSFKFDSKETINFIPNENQIIDRCLFVFLNNGEIVEKKPSDFPSLQKSSKEKASSPSFINQPTETKSPSQLIQNTYTLQVSNPSTQTTPPLYQRLSTKFPDPNLSTANSQWSQKGPAWPQSPSQLIPNSQTYLSQNLQGHQLMDADLDTQFNTDVQRVLSRLGSQKLHSSAAINDYGLISYRDFFLELVQNPEDDVNQMWISNFLRPFSDTWTHSCLVSIRSFIRKHSDYFL